MRQARVNNETVRRSLIKSAEWLNPVAGSPSSALETSAYLDSFGTSLMPRTSQLQGAAGGFSVIASRAVSGILEAATNARVPSDLLTMAFCVSGKSDPAEATRSP